MFGDSVKRRIFTNPPINSPVCEACVTHTPVCGTGHTASIQESSPRPSPSPSPRPRPSPSPRPNQRVGTPAERLRLLNGLFVGLFPYLNPESFKTACKEHIIEPKARCASSRASIGVGTIKTACMKSIVGASVQPVHDHACSVPPCVVVHKGKLVKNAWASVGGLQATS